MVSTSDLRWCGQGSLPRRGVHEFAYQLFNDSNEGTIGGEAEMRGFMVKCGERPLKRERYVKFP